MTSGTFPLRFSPAAMAPASHAAVPARLTAQADSTTHSSIPVPEPGSTALLIHDCRELFKVRVTGMVVVTGWAGFYLGSMQSGISSVQRGLLDTLVGIGLISAGASAPLPFPAGSPSPRRGTIKGLHLVPWRPRLFAPKAT